MSHHDPHNHPHAKPVHASAVVPEQQSPAPAYNTGSPSPVPTEPPAVLPADTDVRETLTGGDDAE